MTSCFGIETTCIRQHERLLPSSSYNHKTLTTLRTSVKGVITNALQCCCEELSCCSCNRWFPHRCSEGCQCVVVVRLTASSLWGCLMQLVLNTKANLPRPLSLQLACNQRNYSVIKQPICFCTMYVGDDFPPLSTFDDSPLMEAHPSRIEIAAGLDTTVLKWAIMFAGIRDFSQASEKSLLKLNIVIIPRAFCRNWGQKSNHFTWMGQTSHSSMHGWDSCVMWG